MDQMLCHVTATLMATMATGACRQDSLATAHPGQTASIQRDRYT
jgi:hypothetical protein